MKTLLSIIFVAWSFSVGAQEIATLSTKARLVQTFTPFVKNNNDDTAYINLFNRWFAKMAVPVQPSGTQLVVVDSISITVIAELYRRAFAYPQGVMAVGTDFASDITAIRAANATLDSLCDAVDAMYGVIIPNARIAGRRIYSGKNQ